MWYSLKEMVVSSLPTTSWFPKDYAEYWLQLISLADWDILYKVSLRLLGLTACRGLNTNILGGFA